VIPVIEGLVAAGTRAQISIDTSKSAVAARALSHVLSQLPHTMARA